MPLDALVKEVELRSTKEVRMLEAKLELERKAVEDRAREEAARIRTEGDRRVALEASRERARLVAAAKLQAKRTVFEAREQRTLTGLGEVRKRLGAYAASPEYAGLLQNMITTGTSVLGSDLRVLARPQDVPLLPTKLRALVDTTKPLTGMGGLVIEKSDGSRALNFTFEELLRQREDRVREILSR